MKLYTYLQFTSHWSLSFKCHYFRYE